MPNVNDGTAKWMPWNENVRDPLPKGPKAIKGDTGPMGPQGPEGPPGSTIELGILRPGDKLVIHIRESDPEQVQSLLAHLEKLGLRDDRVVILCGADLVVIVPQAPVDPEEVRAELISIQKDMREIGDLT